MSSMLILTTYVYKSQAQLTGLVVAQAGSFACTCIKVVTQTHEHSGLNPATKASFGVWDLCALFKSGHFRIISHNVCVGDRYSDLLGVRAGLVYCP